MGRPDLEPYVSERVAFAIKYHQALRFYPDPATGYEYPESYYQTFGIDYVPLPHIQPTTNMRGTTSGTWTRGW